MAAVLGPASDVLLCETMSSVEQATLAHEAVQSQGAQYCSHGKASSDIAPGGNSFPNHCLMRGTLCECECNMNSFACRKMHMGGTDSPG